MKKYSKLKFLSLLLAFSIVFSSTLVCYAEAREMTWKDYLWNDTKTVGENLTQHLILVGTVGGVAYSAATGNLLLAVASGTASLGAIKSFQEFMLDRGFDTDNEEEMKQLITYNVETNNITISDSFNDVAHEYINQFLDAACGYYYFDVPLIDDVNVDFWRNKTGLDRLKTIMSDYDCVYISSNSYGKYYFRISPVNKPVFNYTLVGQLDKGYFKYIDSDWNLQNTTYLKITNENKAIKTTSTAAAPKSYEAFCLYDYDYVKDVDYVDNEIYYSNSASGFYLQAADKDVGYLYYNHLNGVFALEPHRLRVWYDMAKYKEFDLGKQPYYASQEWYNYDYSNTDNSTYSESFIDNSIKDSNNQTTYNEIVNNYHDGMSESEVSHLVEIIMKNQKEINNTPPSSDGGGGSSTGGSGGTGLGALLDGIGGLLDFITTLVGKVVSLITDTLTSILNSFSGFTNLFSGFSEFLASAFSFVPAEVWSILISGCSVIVVLAIIKFLKG